MTERAEEGATAEGRVRDLMAELEQSIKDARAARADDVGFRRECEQQPPLDATWRGHLFDRSVENNMPVLRCRYGDCGFIWWPDQHKPSKPCRSEMTR